MNPKRAEAVFLDRDGTINVDVGYLSDPDELKLIAGAPEAIRRLNDRKIKVIVVTNQSGVERGYFGEAEVAAVNRRLEELLRREGARLDGVYYCPHHPDAGCECRKPKAGLAARASAEHSIDLGRSYVVGDKASDIGLARNMNARAVLVLTGEGTGELGKLNSPPDHVAPDILRAVEWIIDDLGPAPGRTEAQ